MCDPTTGVARPFGDRMSSARTLSDIGDIQAICNRLAQHSRGVDRADEGMLADSYHPDATVDYSFFVGPAKVLAGILAGAQRGQPVTLHRTGQMWVSLDGDQAKSESSVIAYAQSADEDGAMKQRLICGRYLDRHEKRDGAWRISHRTYVLDSNINWAGEGSFSPLAPLSAQVPTGGQGASDPGIALLSIAAARNAAKLSGENCVPQSITPEAADAIISRQQIADLTMAYCRGVDRADEELLHSIFHDDSVVVTGIVNGSGHDFASKICNFVQDHFEQCFHSIANQWFEVTGDTAVGESYILAVTTSKEDSEGKSERLSGGRYIDRFERRDGVWKIAERSYVEDWNRAGPATRQMAEGMYAALTLQGSWGRSDPIYDFWV